MITVFLCGGPGASNPPDRNPEFNDTYLKNGGCIIFLDYRGTGKSILEIRDADKKLMEEWNKCYLPLLRPSYDMADFLKLFRHDDIVRDLEAIRLQLFGADKKWNIFGQSYGGWISLSYLSLFPEALESSRITAGLAPITSNPELVYKHLFEVLGEHNDEYYRKYPEDINRVKKIVKYLLSISPKSPIALANGGWLTARRFLCLGRNLGARDRWAPMHELVEKMHTDITRNKELSKKAIEMYEVEDSWKFDNRPLYAVLHEAMYCSGEESQWAAQRVAADKQEFEWAGAKTELAADKKGWRDILEGLCASPYDKVKIYFSGEMVYPFMFEDYGNLRSLSGVAALLADHKWSNPYDLDQLANNEVPVYAISYESDMHVNEELSQNTAKLVNGIEQAVLDYIPKPKSKEEEQLKRKIRDSKRADMMELKASSERFQHASVRSHANIVLGCMEELVKRP
ncbi:Alpha/Beta hydrolase protein [Pestalotiopsis sp. NC0098]|nr:Alpha/Beta hydrolase protein [Pestalotiopsis sp. NC0098]